MWWRTGSHWYSDHCLPGGWEWQNTSVQFQTGQNWRQTHKKELLLKTILFLAYCQKNQRKQDTHLQESTLCWDVACHHLRSHQNAQEPHHQLFIIFLQRCIRLCRSPGSTAQSWKKAELFGDKYLLAALLSWRKLKARNQGKKKTQLISGFWEVSSE